MHESTGRSPAAWWERLRGQGLVGVARTALGLPPGGSRNAELALRSARLELARRGDAWLDTALRIWAPTFAVGGARRVALVREQLARALELYEEQGWLEAPERFHTRPTLPDPVLVQRAGAAGPGRRAGREDLVFWSGYRPDPRDPAAAAWRRYKGPARARAWMLRHPDPGRPWLVCTHGPAMGTPAVDITAFRARALHREAGLNVLGYVLPLHGARAAAGESAGLLLSRSPLLMLHAQAQAVWDLRRILAWLRAQGAQRIAVHGVSLGANAAALLAALEPALDALVVGAPLTDLAALYRRDRPAAEAPGGRPAAAPDRDDPLWAQLRRALSIVSPLALAPRLERERLAVYAGLADGLAAPRSVHALARHWGFPRTVWYEGGHLGGWLDPAPAALLRETLAKRGLLGPEAPGGAA